MLIYSKYVAFLFIAFFLFCLTITYIYKVYNMLISILKDPRSGRTSPQEEAPNPKIQPRPRMQTARGLFKYTHRYLWAAKSLGGLALPRLRRGSFYRKEGGRSGLQKRDAWLQGFYRSVRMKPRVHLKRNSLGYLGI